MGLFRRFLDVLAPRQCAVCGRRLAIDEELICAACNLHLPRTGFASHADDNAMARLFWGKIPIERAAAWFFYERKSEASRMIHRLKYGDRPDFGYVLGQFLAEDIMPWGFFDGIDAIVPVPIAPNRKHFRGYNQSEFIAKGIAEATGLQARRDVVRRCSFRGSQTQMNWWQRHENVEGAFVLRKADWARGKHLLIVDDILTTGATVLACSKAICSAGDVRISVATVGFAGRK